MDWKELCRGISLNRERTDETARDELHDLMWMFYCKSPSRKTETLLGCAVLVLGAPGRTWYGAPLWILEAIHDVRKHPKALFDISCALETGNYDVLLAAAKEITLSPDPTACSTLSPWHPLLSEMYPELRVGLARSDDVSRGIHFYTTWLRHSTEHSPSRYDVGAIVANLARMVPAESTELVWNAITYYVRREEAPKWLHRAILVDIKLLSVCYKSAYLAAVVRWSLYRPTAFQSSAAEQDDSE